MARRSLVTDQIHVEAWLADSVVAPPDGKLYIQGGGWNIIHTPTVPVRQQRVGVAALIQVPYHLANSEPHKFTIRLEDEDRQVVPLGDAPLGTTTSDGKIREIGGTFTVGRPAGLAPGDEQQIPIAMNLDGLIFNTAGAYAFVIAVDEKDLKRLRFRINQIPQPGAIVR